MLLTHWLNRWSRPFTRKSHSLSRQKMLRTRREARRRNEFRSIEAMEQRILLAGAMGEVGSELILEDSYREVHQINNQNFDFVWEPIAETDLSAEAAGQLAIATDEVEAAWRVCDPILDAWQATDRPTLFMYDPGNWGPEECRQWMSAQGREWFDACPVLS